MKALRKVTLALGVAALSHATGFGQSYSPYPSYPPSQPMYYTYTYVGQPGYGYYMPVPMYPTVPARPMYPAAVPTAVVPVVSAPREYHPVMQAAAKQEVSPGTLPPPQVDASIAPAPPKIDPAIPPAPPRFDPLMPPASPPATKLDTPAPPVTPAPSKLDTPRKTATIPAQAYPAIEMTPGTTPAAEDLPKPELDKKVDAVIPAPPPVHAHAAPSADGDCCHGDSCCHPEPCCHPESDCHNGNDFARHRSGGFVDFLYLKARNQDTVFAQPRDGCLVDSVPKGPLSVLEPDFSGGVRAGAEFALTDCSSIVVSGSEWENQAHAFAVAPPGTVFWSTITLPSTMNCGSDSLQAQAGSLLNFRLADVAFRHLLWSDDCHCAINWLAGMRYAHMRENFRADYTILGATDVESKIRFDGAGPQFGLDGEFGGWAGFSLVARGTANLVAGSFGASFTQNNIFAGNQGNLAYSNDRVVPILDLDLGVAWTSPHGHVRVLVGYEVAGWFNAILTPDFLGAVTANNFTNNGDNLRDTITFDGFISRLEFRY